MFVSNERCGLANVCKNTLWTGNVSLKIDNGKGAHMSHDKREILKNKKERIALGGGQERIEKQHAKGKLSARERLEYFFDDGSFIELDAFIKNQIP